jgi:hypothetical protein
LIATPIFEVVAAHELEAEGLLQTVSSREISNEEAIRLLGSTVDVPPGTKPHLIRAVYLNKGTGAFVIYSRGDDLFVKHGSLGHHAVPMKRQCLVVFLDRSPKRLYVSCSMAE